MRIGSIEKWEPLMAPDEGVGAGEADAGGGAPPVGGDEGAGASDDAGAGGGQREPERRSLRDELENNFDKARRDEARHAQRGDRGRFATRSRGEGDNDGSKDTRDPTKGARAEAGAAGGAGEQEAGATDAPAVQAPAGWSREAKAEWANLSPAVQQAVAKREADTRRGVDEIKSKYADLERAVQPHDEAIRRHGHTRAQAVEQLFGWFQALAQNPRAAFPALAQSFGYDLGQIVGATQQNQQQPGGQGDPRQEQQAPPEIDPGVKAYLDHVFRDRLGPAFNHFAERIQTTEDGYRAVNDARVGERVSAWASDKPHYESVRQTMAQLVQSGVVPLKDGKVDLDQAYEKAVRLHDDVWQKVQDDQRAKRDADSRAAADKRAADDARKAAEARRASASLAPGSPGTDPAAVSRRQAGKGKSVREHILGAIEDARA